MAGTGSNLNVRFYGDVLSVCSGVGDLGSNASRVASTAAELCSLIGAGWDCWGISTPTGYLLEVFEFSQDNTTRKRESCSSYLLLPGENVWRYQTRGVLYALGLVFCFIGLATITALYMRAMEMIVKQTRKVSRKNPVTGIVEVQHEKIWNSTVADITLLALGTSSPQISLAIIDSIQHLGDLYIEGLGPGTLVGSAAFNLLPTLAICVLVPVGGTVKRIEKTRVFAVELTWSIWAYIWLYIMLKMGGQVQESVWVAPVQERCYFQASGNIQTNPSDSVFLHDNYLMSEAGPEQEISVREQWRSQLHTAMTVKVLRDENGKEIVPPFTQLLWHMITFFWRVLFAFIPPTSFGHGWPAFFCALICIAGISTFTIQLANLFGCVSGINRYAISIIVLASGSSFPDLIASKIAVERGNTADSGIANINTSNCINVFVGIGVPWLLQVCYNRIKYGQGLGTETKGLSFSVTVYFAVFTLCWLWVFFRRYHFGGELGGPRNWARASSAFFLSLWVLFVLLSCLRVYNLI
ncbi:hypothetical protein AXG93_4905s1340 [Marchantia polymorpha subsp. ruderalis]|uniref:Sodium/calcium exchanger membrane region domain-containing protein n=1 Tax=Marchantia polymorpha subsp. ruderalis TaxID=1480154 RepID=A0A176VHP7_MARPO|nr:hypothetical protein AXG93_4905s1340 [Marchantia polymorpha subsp. ruderalis]